MACNQICCYCCVAVLEDRWPSQFRVDSFPERNEYEARRFVRTIFVRYITICFFFVIQLNAIYFPYTLNQSTIFRLLLFGVVLNDHDSFLSTLSSLLSSYIHISATFRSHRFFIHYSMCIISVGCCVFIIIFGAFLQ